ncbi:MAG: DUF255 domain-containing protein, partial [Thermoanaerobaculia bacterium]
PIFLSVGYSTCYWCHVMERESFSDPEVAELMNRHFVNVKLDREERPELDEIYMAATQLLTHQGGWPNSVFLTPKLEPYFAGTYFPPADRHGLPGFRTVIDSMAQAWRDRRSDVEEQAAELAQAMRRYLEERGAPASAPPPAAVAAGSLASLEKRFDARWGGFGDAPKFPSPGNLLLLEELVDELPSAGRMLRTTLDQMARGGICDQLGGGFHRYATDGEWKIPHFEKMLYDNGLLLELYAREHARRGDPESARVVRETVEFLSREMTAPEGGLWSAIDAETHGHEGAYYVWTLDELTAVLGAEDAGFLATIFGFDRAPFFEGDSYVLHLPLPLDEHASRRRMGREDLLGQIAPLRARLLAAREERDRPLVDDKVLADWNGMAIAGLAAAGKALGDEEIVARAADVAEFVLGHLRADTLLHSWRGGEAKIPAFLADYAYLIRGLLALDEAVDGDRWVTVAGELADEMIERLADPRGGFFVAAEEPDVLFRSKEIFDGAVPSANAVAILDLLELARRTAEPRYWERAEAALQAFASVAEQQPDAARVLCLAVRRYHRLAEAAGKPVAAGSSPAASPLEDEARKAVTVKLSVEDADEGWCRFTLALEIAPGWHLYAPGEGAAEVLPTEVTGRGVGLRDLVYPEGRELDVEGETARVYEDRAEILGKVREKSGGEPALVLTYQACDDHRCLPPVSVEITWK